MPGRRRGVAVGSNEPASTVVKAPDVTSPAVRDAIQRFKDMALASGGANEPFNVQVNPTGTVAHITIGIAGNGSGDPRSERAIESLRDTVAPQTIGRVPDAQVYITGSVAGTIDFNNQLRRTGPLVVGFVLVLAFGLLLASFRSIVVALKSIVLNLLSVGAAYGVLVLVFQQGYGEKLLGFTSTGMIVNWLPLFLFVILFGLSTDYHVFIVSRIREAYDGGMPTDEAIAHGIKASAGVVTSAALIIGGGLFGVGTMSLLSFMQMGVGLAAAILIDATVVRAVLLPATMKLLGRWNWYLPRWLNWLSKPSHVDTPERAADGRPSPSSDGWLSITRQERHTAPDVSGGSTDGRPPPPSSGHARS